MAVAILTTLFEVTVALWLLAEIVLQVIQWRQGTRAQTTEWRSLAVIVVGIVVGDLLAGVLRNRVPALDLHLSPVLLLCIVLPVTWCGVALRLWAIRTLGRFFRAVVHVQSGHQVVRSGPYRVLRHPSYAGALLAVVGICLVFDNILAMAVFVVCAFAGVWYRITVEERVLHAGLGAAYADYAAQTKRLVPGVW